MTTKQIPHKWKKILCLLLCGLGLVWAPNAAAQDKSMPGWIIPMPERSGWRW